MSSADPFRTDFRTGLSQFLGALGFLTRLPMETLFPAARPDRDLAASAWTFPLAGAVVGFAGGIAYVAASGLGLPPLLSATLAVTTTLWLTAAMHEVALAAAADGLAEAGSREARLDRMEEKQLGVYGVLSLIVSLLLRVAALDAMAWRGRWAILLLLMASEAVGRSAVVRLWQSLEPARPDAMSRERPNERVMLTGLAVAAAVALATGIPAAGFFTTLVALAGAFAVTVAVERIAAERAGGQNVPLLGAGEQAAAIAFLVLVASFA
ncbi:MAG: adenosylcobinamide-GDP ribazoletransferase [Bauldia sp.]